MNGKIVGLVLLVSALLAGAGLYWTQVYAFYEEVEAEPGGVQLTALVSEMAEPVAHDGFEAIDAGSSPLRYRACFDVAMSLPALTETYVLYEAPVPLEAPGWFDCYDADEVGAALESGAALAFLGEANVVYGIDRVVAVFRDGRARSWHQINRCGEAVFDGRAAPEGCPPPPERSE
ncbi:MAG: DUF6446 family protein [Paracoccaceae bacterium]|nr:DUF6446 family protein [Paracoccaceae bacterium]